MLFSIFRIFFRSKEQDVIFSDFDLLLYFVTKCDLNFPFGTHSVLIELCSVSQEYFESYVVWKSRQHLLLLFIIKTQRLGTNVTQLLVVINN